MGESRGTQAGSGNRRQKRSAAEWTTLFGSLAVIGVLIGLVSLTYFDDDLSQVVIEVQPKMEEVRREQDRFYLPVEISNLGERTAEDVRVRFTLAAPDGRLESTELVIGFLPGNGSENGTVVFRSDPATGQLTVESISFIDP